MPMKITPLLLLTTLFAAGCTTNQKTSNTLSVSIEPLRYITERITGEDFQIQVLVPAGSSPETYEPTPSQMKQVAHSLAYIDIGLIDFELNLERAIRNNMPDVTLIKTSEHVSLLEGTCGHNDTEESHNHHGTDPHIWMSPKCVKIMAATIANRMTQLFPDSLKYHTRYMAFAQEMDSLDRALQRLFKEQTTGFMIFHPALTYLAHDYGLTQIAIENEGKEPSASYLRQLIQLARQHNIRNLFYQRQFSRNSVETLAKELQIEAIAIDPLATHVPENIESISTLIVQP